MKDKKIYLFRHGETIATQNRFQWYGIHFFSADILPIGVPTIEKLGEYLKDVKTDLNLTSPFKRCKTTSGIVGKKSNKEFTWHSLLTDHFFIVPPLIFKRRVKRFYKEIMQSSAESIAVCTHEAVIKAIYNLYCKENNFKMDLKLNSKPGVLTILSNGEVQQISFRD